MNVAVQGTELGTGESMTRDTDLIAVLMKLTLPICVEAEGVYCEQEHAVGYILTYEEEDGMLGGSFKEHQRRWVRRATLAGRIDL